MESVKLGMTRKELYGSNGPCCPDMSDGDELVYPTLYLQSPKIKGDIAQEGTITLRYRLTKDSRETKYKSGDEKNSRCIEAEILEIVEVSKETSEKSREKELDEIADEVKKKYD